MGILITTGIFEDQAFFAKSLVEFLQQPGHPVTVCFKAGSQPELLEKLATEIPDVLIMDILAPDVTGLELFSAVLKKYSQLKIIAYTSLKSEILIENLLSLGVKGYVNKQQAPEDLLQAIKEVYHGHISLPVGYMDLLRDDRSQVKQVFSNRELQLLRLISNGETSAQIAATLDISLRTVENLKASLFDKLSVKNAAELMVAASRLGYVS